MKIRKKVALKIFLGTVITFAICFVLYILFYSYIGISFLLSGPNPTEMRVRLLCSTDCETLLESCRELSEKVIRGDLKYGQYNIRKDPNPEISQFPQTILALAPNYVFIDKDGRVMIEMLGGLGHCGVQAYPENYILPSYSVYGDKRLIDGLWYYDDGYRKNPEFDKIIEELIQNFKNSRTEQTKEKERIFLNFLNSITTTPAAAVSS